MNRHLRGSLFTGPLIMVITFVVVFFGFTLPVLLVMDRMENPSEYPPSAAHSEAAKGESR